MDSTIEAALQPGRYISYNDGDSFVGNLQRVEAEITKLVGSEPARAVTLYETFMAGCLAKADDIDDSDGEFGTIAGGLFGGWIEARQAAGADRSETARLLLGRMDDDPYGFCNDLELSAVQVLDKAGLEAFEQEVRGRFDQAGPNANFVRDRWCQVLKAVYSQRRDIGKYIDLTARTGTTPADCETIAAMFQAKRKPSDALTWVERGLAMGKPNDFWGGTSDKLGEMRRALLVKLGRAGEALDSAWAEFQAHPGTDTYEQLLRYVPKTERGAWRERAMEAAQQGDLGSLIGLWIAAKEMGRLAERLDGARDAELERLSHYVTEPAAECLAKNHPAVAAKVFRALCIRVLDAGKSQYYYAALAHLEKAQSCYRRAGLDAHWETLAAEIRSKHHRKSGFMPGFERIVRGAGPSREPSFLDEARKRWANRARS
jgi:hypothetical protein